MSPTTRRRLYDQLGAEVRAHQRAVDGLDEAVADHLGINRTDLRCLDVLLERRAATPGQLAVALGLTTGSVTAMLDRLERQGYATRGPDPADRRGLRVRPTHKAARAAEQIYGPVAKAGVRGFAAYSAEDLGLLIGFLRRSRALQESHSERIRKLKMRGRRRRR